MEPSTNSETLRIKGTARFAWVLGMLSVVMAMVGPCMGYMPMLIAVPLAIVSILQARTALRSEALDEGGQIYGQTAMVNSSVALAWSLLVLGIVALIMLMYFGFFAAYLAMIIAIVSQMPPPPPPGP